MTRAEWAKRPLAERSAAAHCICNYALDLPDVPAQQEDGRVAIVAALIWWDGDKGFGSHPTHKQCIVYARECLARIDAAGKGQ